MRVLSAADYQFWQENGYVIIHDAVPPENLQAVTATLWAFQELNPDDPDSWYVERRANEMPELNKAGMVEIYHHQALWDNRQQPRVYGAFVDIWGREDLWVTIDRANMNLPVRPGWEFQGFIHWDIDTGLEPLPFEVQGILSLADTQPGQGGFQCVPGFHRRFAEWVKTQPADRDTWHPDTSDLDIVRVPMKAGDLLIWHSLLPHGTSPNHSTQPRLAQYISMFPAKEDDAELREWRIRSWRERLPREGFAFPQDPRQWEQKHGTTAELTPLGRKLLGLDSWR